MEEEVRNYNAPSAAKMIENLELNPDKEFEAAKDYVRSVKTNSNMIFNNDPTQPTIGDNFAKQDTATNNNNDDVVFSKKKKKRNVNLFKNSLGFNMRHDDAKKTGVSVLSKVVHSSSGIFSKSATDAILWFSGFRNNGSNETMILPSTEDHITVRDIDKIKKHNAAVNTVTFIPTTILGSIVEKTDVKTKAGAIGIRAGRVGAHFVKDMIVGKISKKVAVNIDTDGIVEGCLEQKPNSPAFNKCIKALRNVELIEGLSTVAVDFIGNIGESCLLLNDKTKSIGNVLTMTNVIPGANVGVQHCMKTMVKTNSIGYNKWFTKEGGHRKIASFFEMDKPDVNDPVLEISGSDKVSAGTKKKSK